MEPDPEDISVAHDASVVDGLLALDPGQRLAELHSRGSTSSPWTRIGACVACSRLHCADRIRAEDRTGRCRSRAGQKTNQKINPTPFSKNKSDPF
jgi:hypothetical protein